MNNKNYFEDIRSVTLIMTTDCTLRCKYCFTQDYGFKAEYADQKLFINFINEIQEKKNSGSIDFLFFGGEPFVHFKQMKEIQEYYEKKDFIYSNTKILFSVVTNGTILNNQIVKFINKYLHNIQFSIDGSINVQDENRITPQNKGSYYLILNNLQKYLPEIKTNISIKQTYNEFNQKHMLTNYIDQYQNYFNPFKNINFTSMMIRNMKSFNQNDQLKYIDEYEKTYEWWYENFVRKGLYKEAAFFGEFVRNIQDINNTVNNYFTTKQKIPCGQGKQLLGIDQNGNIFPCHHFQYSEPGYTYFKLAKYTKFGDLDKLNTDRLDEFNSYDLSEGSCKYCQASQNCYYCLAENYQYRKNLNQADKKVCLTTRSEFTIQMNYYRKIVQTNKDFIDYINGNDNNDIVNINEVLL